MGKSIVVLVLSYFQKIKPLKLNFKITFSTFFNIIFKDII